MYHNNHICIFNKEKEKKYLAFFQKPNEEELFLKADSGVELTESYGFMKCSNFDKMIHSEGTLKDIVLKLKELVERKMNKGIIHFGSFLPFYIGVTLEDYDEFGKLIGKLDGIVLKLNTNKYNLTKKFEYQRIKPEIWNKVNH